MNSLRPCKNCGRSVFLQPPMWPKTSTQEEGPRNWSHEDGNPLCQLFATPEED